MVARALFAGTHLENAPQWMLEIEAMTTGGWKRNLGPKVRVPERAPPPLTDNGSAKQRGRARSATLQFRLERVVRIVEPRAAPRPSSVVRHHHFEQKTILASRKGSVSVPERRAAYVEGFNAPGAIIPAEVRVTNEASYTEGGRSTDAERVIYVTGTNGADYAERMKFWQLANDSAHFVGEHAVTVRTRGVEEGWDRLTRDPTMPGILREAIAGARASSDGEARLVVNDAGVVKRWLKKRKAPLPAELRPHLELETPHNGRVAYSLVGQFPHDLSTEGMKVSLNRLVKEFTVRQVPCQAVIHQPTAKNSAKNWHFHLIYYAGEAERLADGRWSFERELRRDKWRTMKSVPLKRLGRNEEIAAEDWIPRLKRRWSEIVNQQAIAEGIATRFTNETNETRGLPKAATRRSPARQAMQKQGFFTDTEIEANIETWRVWRRRKRASLRRQVREVKLRFERAASDLRIADLPPDAKKQALAGVKKGKLVLADIDALIDTATQAAMLRYMIESGPKDVAAYYSAVNQSLGKKPSTAARSQKRAFAQKVCRAADAHLAGQDSTLNRLRQTQEQAVSALKQAHSALRNYLPQLEASIEAGDVSSTRVDAEVASATQTRARTVAMADRSRAAIAAHLRSGSAIEG